MSAGKFDLFSCNRHDRDRGHDSYRRGGYRGRGRGHDHGHDHDHGRNRRY